MRQFLMTGIITSSCLMVLLGYQNCTKNTVVQAKTHVVSLNR